MKARPARPGNRVKSAYSSLVDPKPCRNNTGSWPLAASVAMRRSTSWTRSSRAARLDHDEVGMSGTSIGEGGDQSVGGLDETLVADGEADAQPPVGAEHLAG